jgi:DNA polymerase-4
MPLVAERGLTLLGFSLTNLADVGGDQLVLPLDRRDGLDAALDDVRERFGSGAITRAVLLGRDTGFSMPQLPD